MNLEACTFERLAFISLGFGRGAEVGKALLLKVKLYGASVDVGRIDLFIIFWYASGPGIQPNLSIFGRRRRIFYNAKQR